MSERDKGLGGRRIIVTGASSGIGEATARQLASEGAVVAIVSRGKAALDKVAASIKDSGGHVHAVVADLANEDAAHQAIAEAARAMDGVDVLVNNAGVAYFGEVEAAPRPQWRQMVELNLLGTMSACQAVVPLFRARGGGHIVNMSSLTARSPSVTTGGYSATKAGILAFSETLRKEVWAHGIRVTVIEPGTVATPIFDLTTDPKFKADIGEFLKNSSPLVANDVAEAVAFAIARPARVNIDSIILRPLSQGAY